MNIEKLVAAAKELDRLCIKSEARSKRFSELATAARKCMAGSIEHKHLQDECRELGCTVVDYGDALNALRRALKARPAPKVKA